MQHEQLKPAVLYVRVLGPYGWSDAVRGKWSDLQDGGDPNRICVHTLRFLQTLYLYERNPLTAYGDVELNSDAYASLVRQRLQA